MRSRHHLAAVCLLLAAGCSGTPQPRLETPPPLTDSFSADWSYGLAVLNRGDLDTARVYLERAQTLETGEADPQFHRDLAEVRLFAGDLAGADEEARVSSAALVGRPSNARFTISERRLFERLVQALELSAADDEPALAALADDHQTPPLGDAWYLLGWARERRGDAAEARAAYAAYLDEAPMWSFLRQAESMQQHARAVVAGGQE